MSESTSSAVECPVCGEEFDPTDAGGWCTNPDCGEWQYIGEEVPEPAESSADAAEVDLSVGDDADGDAESAVAADGADGADAAPDDGQDESAEAEAADASGEPTPAITPLDDAEGTSDAAADEAGEAESDQAETDDDGGAATADADATAADAASAPAADDGGDLTCPDCGTTVAADDNFCADCGANLDELDSPTLAECPGCGGEVDEDDSFCATCGEDLDAAREALQSAQTADVAEEPTETPEADADDDQGAAATDAPAPDSLVLRLQDEDIVVRDDETVGREVRRILTKTGAAEDEAVRIHREHVRFVREDGAFYLVDLGDNPTVLNGRYLSKGDREPVEPGDELELSEVATLSIEAP
jgi:hypothetical protein